MGAGCSDGNGIVAKAREEERQAVRIANEDRRIMVETVVVIVTS